jgi:hypothetical protein
MGFPKLRSKCTPKVLIPASKAFRISSSKNSDVEKHDEDDMSPSENEARMAALMVSFMA